MKNICEKCGITLTTYNYDDNNNRTVRLPGNSDCCCGVFDEDGDHRNALCVACCTRHYEKPTIKEPIEIIHCDCGTIHTVDPAATIPQRRHKMNHPFEHEEDLRHSASSIREMVDETNIRCSCGSNYFVRDNNVPTHPVLPFNDRDKVKFIESTCDRYKCGDCKKEFEVAWKITYSMCVLKDKTRFCDV